MLDSFRSFAGSPWAKIGLVFLVLSFGVWGVGDMLRGGRGNQAVATVGGETISAMEFQREMSKQTENMRRVLGDNYSPELVSNLHVPEQVLQRLINHKLISLESTALGLVPGDIDVVRRIRSNPMFQDSKGNFDKRLFEAMLHNANLSEKTYVDQLRDDMAANLLVDSLLSATPVSDQAVRTLFAAREEQRTVTLYRLGPSLVAGVPQPTGAQITAYYNDHKSDFTAPEFRNVSYVTIGADDIKNVPIPEDELRASYKERLDEFRQPERRTVEQLLYAGKDEADKAGAMLKAGKSVEEVAKDTDIVNKHALSLGTVERSAIFENAADAVFALPQGGSTAPVKSPFGWHIFHVSAILPPSVAPFEQVRPQLEKDIRQRDADDALGNLANKLQDALAGGATFAEATKSLGLKMISIGPFNRQGLTPDGTPSKDLPPKGIADGDKFLAAAFKTDERSESPLMTAKGGIYYLLHVDKVTPERLRALDEVRGMVASEWQKQEREKHLGTLARTIAEKLAKSATRDAVIGQYHLQPATEATLKRSSHTAGTISLPPELIADIFSHAPGEGTGAYQAKDDYLAAVVRRVIPAPSPGKDPKLEEVMVNTRSGLASDVQNEVLGEYTRYLAGKYPVTVNAGVLKSLIR